MGLETFQGCWWAGAEAHWLWKEVYLPLLWAFFKHFNFTSDLETFVFL